MSKPGVVVRRPVGSDGPFREHADLPTDLAGDGPKPRPKNTLAKPKDQVPRTTDDTAARKTALAFEREQRRRENQRRKEEAARERDRQRRNQAIARVQAALGKSEREHHEGVVRVTGGTIDRLAGSALLEFKRVKRARGAATIQGV